MTALDDRTTYAPFHLYKHEDQPHWTLMLSNFSASVMDRFEEAGRHPGGYGWADVTLWVLEQEDSLDAASVELDPESDTYVALVKDIDALKRLARALHRLFHDEQALATALEYAPYEYD